MNLVLKALAGAAVVVVIQLLARSKRAYIAGLVPLFPTFALIAHYLVGTQRGVYELKQTIRFGMWSLLPYWIYLAVLYLLVDRWSLPLALGTAVGTWFIAALALLLIWNRT